MPAHVIVPFASVAAPAAQQAMRQLHLPHLAAWLQRLSPQAVQHWDAQAYHWPHEAVLATAYTGCADHNAATGTDTDTEACPCAVDTPWAAWLAAASGHAAQAGTPWGIMTLCHWQIETSAVRMAPLSVLADVSADEANALFAAMQPWLAQDGLHLHPIAPCPLADNLGIAPVLQRLVRGSMLAGVRTASVQRVAGWPVQHWLPRSVAPDTAANAARSTGNAAAMQRLQSEMQMLLHTHPVNAARLARHAQPVNSIWISATGNISTPMTHSPIENHAGAGDTPAPTVCYDLMHAALQGDWPAWQAAWQALDARVLAALPVAAHGQRACSITLCGETVSRTWGHPLRGRVQAWLNRYRAAPVGRVLQELAECA